MRLDPDREPITRPVFDWLEVAAQLADSGGDSRVKIGKRSIAGGIAGWMPHGTGHPASRVQRRQWANP